LSRVFSSSAFIKSAITGQRVTPENRFATPKRAALFFVAQRGLFLSLPGGRLSEKILKD
jgi:hypothetical protein